MLWHLSTCAGDVASWLVPEMHLWYLQLLGGRDTQAQSISSSPSLFCAYVTTWHFSCSWLRFEQVLMQAQKWNPGFLEKSTQIPLVPVGTCSIG
jgi:hypothetical protein